MLWLIPVGFVAILFFFCLGIWFHSWSLKASYGGTIVVQRQSDGKLMYTLVVGGDLEQLQYKKDILFRITPVDSDTDLDELELV